jgi:predicted esterase
MTIADVIAKHGLRVGGMPPDAAKGVVLLIHGRGATAASMLPLGAALAIADICYLAPQAEGNTWYPQSFMAPVELNEPYQSRSLTRIATIVADLSVVGLAADKLGLIGFSQGACLAAETVLRNPRPYGFVGILSGGAIGPPGTPRDYAGSLAGARTFIGCSDRDPHIPLARVKETSAVFARMGANVTERIYGGSAHDVNDDELGHLQSGLTAMTTT